MLKKLFFLALVLTLVGLAGSYHKDPCSRIDLAFEKSGFLISEFADYQGAYTVLDRLGVSYFFRDKKLSQRACTQKHLTTWIEILAKNKKLYPLKHLYDQYRQNPLLPKMLGDIYRQQNRIPKALQYYREYLKLKPNPVDQEVADYLKRGGKELYHSRWAKHLNPQNEIPKNRFKNIFFNFKTKKIIQTTYTPDIRIFSIGKQFDTPNLDIASYHVGEFAFDSPQKYALYFECGQAKECRLIIDDLLVTKRALRGKPYLFSKGSHKIEIEYLNAAHLYNHRFLMAPAVTLLGQEELTKALSHRHNPLWLISYQVNHRSTGKSGAWKMKFKTPTVHVTLKPSEKPVTLLLQSTSAVDWNITNSSQAETIIVGYHSNRPDTVQTDQPVKQILYTRLSMESEEYPPRRKCICPQPGVLLCHNNFLQRAKLVREIFGEDIAAYTYTKEPNITAPAQRIDKDKLQKQIDALNRQEHACQESRLNNVFPDKKDHR